MSIKHKKKIFSFIIIVIIAFYYYPEKTIIFQTTDKLNEKCNIILFTQRLTEKYNTNLEYVTINPNKKDNPANPRVIRVLNPRQCTYLIKYAHSPNYKKNAYVYLSESDKDYLYTIPLNPATKIEKTSLNNFPIFKGKENNGVFSVEKEGLCFGFESLTYRSFLIWDPIKSPKDTKWFENLYDMSNSNIWIKGKEHSRHSFSSRTEGLSEVQIPYNALPDNQMELRYTDYHKKYGWLLSGGSRDYIYRLTLKHKVEYLGKGRFASWIKGGDVIYLTANEKLYHLDMSTRKRKKIVMADQKNETEVSHGWLCSIPPKVSPTMESVAAFCVNDEGLWLYIIDCKNSEYRKFGKIPISWPDSPGVTWVQPETPKGPQKGPKRASPS